MNIKIGRFHIDIWAPIEYSWVLFRFTSWHKREDGACEGMWLIVLGVCFHIGIYEDIEQDREN